MFIVMVQYTHTIQSKKSFFHVASNARIHGHMKKHCAIQFNLDHIIMTIPGGEPPPLNNLILLGSIGSIMAAVPVRLIDRVQSLVVGSRRSS